MADPLRLCVGARHNGILLYRFGGASWNSLSFNPHEDTPPGMSAGLPVVESRRHLTVSVGLADVDRASRIDDANYLHMFVGNERLAQRAGMRCTSTR